MKISRREYIFLAAGIGVVLFLAASEFIYEPYWVRHQTLKKEIGRLERDLRQVRVLSERFRRNKSLLSEIEGRLVRGGDGFSLFSFLEEAAGKAGIQGRLEAMTPSQGDAGGKYRKLEMAVRFKELTLGELVRFLEFLDRAPKLIRVEQLRVDRSSRKPGRVKVSAKVVTFSLQKT